jgi:hypothetical protein
MLHIPLLRADSRTGVSTSRTRRITRRAGPSRKSVRANVGLIRRDLLAQEAMRASLVSIPVARLIEMTRQAAQIFLNDTLPIGSDTQRPTTSSSKCPRRRGCRS